MTWRTGLSYGVVAVLLGIVIAALVAAVAIMVLIWGW